MSKWITANAFAQRELAAAISPNVSRRTVAVAVKSGLSGQGLRLVFEEAYGKKNADYLEVTAKLGEKTLAFTVDGQKAFSVAPGERVVTDFVEAAIAAGEEMTIYIAVGEGQSMSETSLEQRHSAEGNFCGGGFVAEPYQNPLPGVPFTERLCGLKEIQVLAEETAAGIVAFGDSVTESAVWVNPLGEKFAEIRPNTTLLNLGIGGNRLLRDTNVPAMMGINAFGKAALSRMDSDIFALSGVKAVIFALGINDIAQPGGPMGFSPPISELCTVEELQAGIEKAVVACREKGLSVIGTTITPFKGYPSYAEKSAAIRNEVNAWIKACDIFDYVIDFAALLCAKDDSESLEPAYGLGDGLHPNPMGGAAAVAQLDVAEILKAIHL